MSLAKETPRGTARYRPLAGNRSGLPAHESDPERHHADRRDRHDGLIAGEGEHPQGNAHEEGSGDEIEQRDDARMTASNRPGLSRKFDSDSTRSMEDDGHGGIVIRAGSRPSDVG